jgi:transposase
MANCQIFLNALAHQYPDTVTIVLMDNGSCHTAKALVVPEPMGCLFLPPYRPERNPIERLWQDVKAQLARVLPPRIEALEARVETIIR